MTDLKTLQDRVQKGAAWLDTIRDGWWKEVNLDALSLSHCSRCVLGQLFDTIPAVNFFRTGSFEPTAEQILGFFNLTEVHPDVYRSIDMGFNLGDDDLAKAASVRDAELLWDKLTLLWKDLILDRRSAALLASSAAQQQDEVPVHG